MYYYCAKLTAFKLPELSERAPAGSVIAASAMPLAQLTRRAVTNHSHMQHRLLDPQLYLASLDPRVANSTVYKLATYPWFGANPPTYDSSQHGTLNEFKTRFTQEIVSRWPQLVPSTEQEILQCVKNSLTIQTQLGCEVLIVPSPLTSSLTDYRLEAKYLDAAVQAVSDLKISLPVYATIAVSDALLRSVQPTDNRLIQTITDHIASRTQLTGAYVVLEQTADTGYVCVNENVLFGLLILVDDLVRGAGRQVIVNYVGSFGPVTAAAGATIWASAYYRSQRRMRLADQEEETGRAYPRFYSHTLAGDIGVENDLTRLKVAGLLPRIFSRSQASTALHSAIIAGRYPSAAPQWEYRPGMIWAAAAHYNDIACKTEAYFDSCGRSARVDAVEHWLSEATQLAQQVENQGISLNHTDARHQAIWLSAFRKWRAYANC
jgi:hypothetical protein